MRSVAPYPEHVIIRDAPGVFDPMLLDIPRSPISLGILETRQAATEFYTPEKGRGGRLGNVSDDMSLDEIIAGGNPVVAGLAQAAQQFLIGYCPPNMQRPKVYPFVRVGRNHGNTGLRERVRRHLDGSGDLIIFAASVAGPAIYDPSPYAAAARQELARDAVPPSHPSYATYIGGALDGIMPQDAPTVPVQPWEILVGDKYMLHGTPVVDSSQWRIFGRLSLYFYTPPREQVY